VAKRISERGEETASDLEVIDVGLVERVFGRRAHVMGHRALHLTRTRMTFAEHHPRCGILERDRSCDISLKRQFQLRPTLRGSKVRRERVQEGQTIKSAKPA
jgi:hypothetical protein